MAIRRTLVALHWAYTVALGIIASIFGFALAIIFILIGVELAHAGWPNPLAVGGGAVLILIGVMGFLHTLPGITPGLRGGRPGDARIARLRDVRRSGIYRRR